MISAGSNITANADILHKVTIKYLYDSLRNPRPSILSSIRQLRIVREIDAKQYAVLKRRLPYIVCGMFNPSFRKIENFAYTNYFVVDIDHLSEKGLSIYDLRKRLEQDRRVVLSFLSPGEDGLKLFFRLKERCYDSGIYTLFYKAFLKSFSLLYELDQVVDVRTSDVTRACFISVDKDAYYNPEAEAIDLQNYVEMDNSYALFDLKRQQEDEEKLNIPIDQDHEKDPDKETMERIKQLLNPKLKKKCASIYVPKELDDMMNILKPYVEQTGVSITDVVNIQYGKKLRFKMGAKKAEVNLFFGKRGFSVVQSPRTGTDSDLNQLMADLVVACVNEHC